MKPVFSLEINEKWLKMGFPQSAKADGSVDEKVKVLSVTGLKDDQIIEAIKEVCRGLKIKSGSVILSLPRNQVIVRNVHLPSKDEIEIQQMISLHVGRIVPYRKEDSVYSYKILGRDDRRYTKAMIAIVHQDVIRRLDAIIEAAGFFVEDIFLSSYGSLGYVIDKCKNDINPADVNLILEIDSSYVDFIAFSDNKVLYSRSIPVEVTQIFQETGMKKLFGEIRQSLVIFHSEETSKKPARIYVMGARVNIADFVKTLEKELEIPVKTISFEAQKDVSFPQFLSVAAVKAFMAQEKTGPVMRFLIPEIQIRKSLNERAKELMILGGLILFFIMALGGIFTTRIYHQQAYLEKLQSRNKDIFLSVGDALEQSRKVDFVKGVLTSRKVPMAFLNRLFKIMPKETAIKSVSLDKDKKIVLRGEARELSDVFKFVGELEKASYISDVRTKSTRRRKVQDKEITDFELSFVLTGDLR